MLNPFVVHDFVSLIKFSLVSQDTKKYQLTINLSSGTPQQAWDTCYPGLFLKLASSLPDWTLALWRKTLDIQLHAKSMTLWNNRSLIRRGISWGLPIQQRSCFSLLCLSHRCACIAFVSHDSPSHCVSHALHVLHDIVTHVWHVPHGDKRSTARGRGWGGIHVWLVWEDVIMSNRKDEHLNAHQEILLN